MAEPEGLAGRVKSKVERVVDPETGLTLGEMGLIKRVKEVESGVVQVDFTPSSPYCPIALKLAMDIKRAAEGVRGVKKALVYCRGHIMEDAINNVVNKG